MAAQQLAMQHAQAGQAVGMRDAQPDVSGDASTAGPVNEVLAIDHPDDGVGRTGQRLRFPGDDVDDRLRSSPTRAISDCVVVVAANASISWMSSPDAAERGGRSRAYSMMLECSAFRRLRPRLPLYRVLRHRIVDIATNASTPIRPRVASVDNSQRKMTAAVIGPAGPGG